MIDSIVAFVAKHAGKERSTTTKLLSLLSGILVFFVVAPIALGLIGHWVSLYVKIMAPRVVEVSLGITGIASGLFFLLWAVSAFWLIGRGTPVPFASPTRLVTQGPFKYTRNPIKLGAVLFYFGTGSSIDTLVTGVTMLVIGLTLGSLYHKTIEEKELLLRFGEEYEAYRRRTSFLIPMPPKR